VKGKIAPVHAMKAYGVQSHSLLSSPKGTSEGSA
jgi:hypothetical protein